MKIFNNILTGIALLLIVSCTQADIHYRQQVERHGYVIIRPDNSVHTLGANLYHFYHTDGVTPCFTENCDGKGNFEGELPAGTYHVLATNTNAVGVKFRGMDNYETAMVTLEDINSRPMSRLALVPSIEDWRMRGIVDPVFSTVLSNLTVVADESAEYIPSPVCLTKTVSIAFHLDDALRERASALSGLLRGVYPSVNLYTQCPSESSVATAPETFLHFKAQKQEDLDWTAQLHLFGLCDPQHGDAYTNTMDITLQTRNGDLRTTVDLTEILSNIIDQNEGTIPIEIPLEIELIIDGMELKGTVKPWKEGGTGETPV